MIMNVKIAAALLATASLAACATAPQTYTFDKARVVPESKDVVWERVVEFFAMNNLSIKTIEKDSGIIAAERMISTPSQDGNIAGWASCGTGMLTIPTAQTVDMNVFVRPAGAGTSVTVNTRFSETRQFADSPPQRVDCNSNGTLEGMILGAAAGR